MNFKVIALGTVVALVSLSCVSKSKYESLEAAKNQETEARAKTEAQVRAEAAQKQKLAEALSKTEAEKQAELEKQRQLMAEIEKRQAEIDRRDAQLKNLSDKLKALTDAGKLKVRVSDGRLVIDLPSDILFSSGSARLSKDGKATIVEIGKTLAEVKDQRFQVEGYTDNEAIQTAVFPSNWDLAAARALTVLKTLLTAGMDPARISAASYGEQRPVASNDSKEGRSLNRRIEIAMLPNLSEIVPTPAPVPSESPTPSAEGK